MEKKYTCVSVSPLLQVSMFSIHHQIPPSPRSLRPPPPPTVSRPAPNAPPPPQSTTFCTSGARRSTGLRCKARTKACRAGERVEGFRGFRTNGASKESFSSAHRAGRNRSSIGKCPRIQDVDQDFSGVGLVRVVKGSVASHFEGMGSLLVGNMEKRTFQTEV